MPKARLKIILAFRGQRCIAHEVAKLQDISALQSPYFVPCFRCVPLNVNGVGEMFGLFMPAVTGRDTFTHLLDHINQNNCLGLEIREMIHNYGMTLRSPDD